MPKKTLVPSQVAILIVRFFKLEPKLVRQLSSPRSPVKSSSVTVVFEWEASHDFDREWDFWDKLGEFGEDGEMVRRVVTNITAYYESSLVWLGADPFAGKLDENGQVVEIDRASVISNSRSSDEYTDLHKKHKKYFIYSCSELEKDILLKMNKDSDDKSHLKNSKNSVMEKELLERLAKLNNCKVEELTKEMIEKFELVIATELTSLKADKESLVTVTSEKETLEGEKTKLVEEKTELEKEKNKSDEKVVELEKTISDNAELVKSGEANLVEMRKHTEELYTKFVGDKVDSTIVDEIKENNIEQLEAKLKLYGDKTVSKFGGHCNKCESTDISYRTSIDNGGTEGDDAPALGMAEQAQINR